MLQTTSIQESAHNESTVKFTLTFETRQQALRAYIAVHGPKFSEISRKLKIAVSSASDLCKSETASPLRVEQLKVLGIPEELLPIPLNAKPGPKSKRWTQDNSDNIYTS